jgi:hypothetical protein
MRVRCISKRGELLPKEYIDPRVNVTRDADYRVTSGKEYLVYAIAFRRGQVWYYLIDDNELWYPRNLPAPLFEITDGRVSRFWKVNFTPGNPDHDMLLAFPEWDSNDLFYGRLTDRVPVEVAVFGGIKSKMDEEFGS